jgi:hypothetical protein
MRHTLMFHTTCTCCSNRRQDHDGSGGVHAGGRRRQRHHYQVQMLGIAEHRSCMFPAVLLWVQDATDAIIA